MESASRAEIAPRRSSNEFALRSHRWAPHRRDPRILWSCASPRPWRRRGQAAGLAPRGRTIGRAVPLEAGEGLNSRGLAAEHFSPCGPVILATLASRPNAEGVSVQHLRVVARDPTGALTSIA